MDKSRLNVCLTLFNRVFVFSIISYAGVSGSHRCGTHPSRTDWPHCASQSPRWEAVVLCLPSWILSKTHWRWNHNLRLFFLSLFVTWLVINKMTLEFALYLITHRSAHVWPVCQTGGGAAAERESREEKEGKEKEEREAQSREETWLGSRERGRHHTSSHGWHCYRGDARGTAGPCKRRSDREDMVTETRHKIYFIRFASVGHSKKMTEFFSYCCIFNPCVYSIISIPQNALPSDDDDRDPDDPHKALDIDLDKWVL